MKIFIALIVLAAVSASVLDIDYAYEFEKFKSIYGKTYANDTAAYRFEIFKKNVQLINAHNAKQLDWTLGVNEFADLTWDEFRVHHLGLTKPKIVIGGVPRSTFNLTGAFTVPDTIDWVTKGAVTGVKNQGQCGSCWAFSTTGSIEGAVAIKTGHLISVSEQQLVDCSTAEGNQGCNGGLMDDAFQYVIKNGGICSEASYPYKAVDGTCQTCTPVSKISSYVDVTHNDEKALQAAAALNPVSVAVEADQMGFQFYSGGIFSGTCGTNLDHGVLVVGYGSDSGQDYWLVKNSWGATWGLQGYIKLVRNIAAPTGQCGIAMEPSYPVAA
jgi:C1A family cysteine protease